MSRNKRKNRREKGTSFPPFIPMNDVRNRDVKGIAQYCAASKETILAECDWQIVDENGGYLGFLKRPGAKILAVAHLDYVSSGVVHGVNDEIVVSSALDDRLGVYIALHMLQRYGIVADVLLTDNEECGATTIRSLSYDTLAKYNWIIELDRRGTDAVIYGYHEMKKHLEPYFKVGYGLYSDISEIEDVCPVGAFNMGIGYQWQHTENCHVYIDDIHKQLKRLQKFYKLYKSRRIEHEHSAVSYNHVEWTDTKDDYYEWKGHCYDEPQEEIIEYLDDYAYMKEADEAYERWLRGDELAEDDHGLQHW